MPDFSTLFSDAFKKPDRNEFEVESVQVNSINRDGTAQVFYKGVFMPSVANPRNRAPGNAKIVIARDGTRLLL